MIGVTHRERLAAQAVQLGIQPEDVKPAPAPEPTDEELNELFL